MKTTIFLNVIVIVTLGIGMVVGGLTESALAQTNNQTNADQDKNNTGSGGGIMDKIEDVAKQKIKEGVQEIVGGINNK